MLNNANSFPSSNSDKEENPKIRVAAVQMASGPSVSANLEEALRLIELAVTQQAKLVVLLNTFASWECKIPTNSRFVKNQGKV